MNLALLRHRASRLGLILGAATVATFLGLGLFSYRRLL